MVDDLKAAATSKQFVTILEAMLAMLQVGCSRVGRPSTGAAMTVCAVQQTLEFPTNAQQFPCGAFTVVARDHLTSHPAEWSLEARKLRGKVNACCRWVA